MIIYKKYFFDAAHFLTDFKKNHKYSKVHGHSYEMTVRISGEINKSNCWVIDFEDIDKCLAKKILDDDMTAIISCINAKYTLKQLKLTGCVNILGTGLKPLANSTVLELIDRVH